MKQAILASLISFIIVAIASPYIIPFLTKLKFGQYIREEGPKEHYKKAGTPTMGGIIIVVAIIFSSLIFYKSTSIYLLIAVGGTFLFGLIGFTDDYIKVVKKHNLGLRSRQKLILQLLLAVLIALYAMYDPKIGTDIMIPFTNMSIDLGWAYLPFVVFIVLGTVNGVNLTDGLDGLAAGVTMLVVVFFLILSFLIGFTSMALFSGCIIGALLGFLLFNFHPAKIFMGDTGSLALGGALSIIAVFTKTELFLGIIGGIYVLETISVIIQVSYFKTTKGKRFFKMAPIHHHFELKGWSETKIVMSFWAITVLLVLISILALPSV